MQVIGVPPRVGKAGRVLQSKQYLQVVVFLACRSGTYFCMDKSVTAVVIQGLAEHKDTLGAPLCPCRHYDDKEAEAAQGYWNCPCVPMRERKVGLMHQHGWL
jgi:ferredoxin-thioredoxin reductase catalytic subunit